MRGQLKNRAWLRPADLARRYQCSFNTIVNRINAGAIVAEPERVRKMKAGKLRGKLVPCGWKISREEVRRIDREGMRPPQIILAKKGRAA